MGSREQFKLMRSQQVLSTRCGGNGYGQPKSQGTRVTRCE